MFPPTIRLRASGRALGLSSLAEGRGVVCSYKTTCEAPQSSSFTPKNYSHRATNEKTAPLAIFIHEQQPGHCQRPHDRNMLSQESQKMCLNVVWQDPEIRIMQNPCSVHECLQINAEHVASESGAN